MPLHLFVSFLLLIHLISENTAQMLNKTAYRYFMRNDRVHEMNIRFLLRVCIVQRKTLITFNTNLVLANEIIKNKGKNGERK